MRSRSRPSIHINDLPEEILRKSFGYQLFVHGFDTNLNENHSPFDYPQIELAGDLEIRRRHMYWRSSFAVLQVSRYWFLLAIEFLFEYLTVHTKPKFLWDEICDGLENLILPSWHWKKTKPAGQYVKRLEIIISDTSSSTVNYIIRVMHACPNVTSLAVQFYCNQNRQAQSLLLEKVATLYGRSLLQFECGGANSAFEDIILIQHFSLMQNLTFLDLTFTMASEAEREEDLALTLPFLTMLALRALDHHMIEFIALWVMPKLDQLHIDDISDAAVTVPFFQQHRNNLRSLAFQDVGNDSELLSQILLECPSLTDLSFDVGCFPRDGEMPEDANLAVIGHSNIQCIGLYGVNHYARDVDTHQITEDIDYVLHMLREKIHFPSLHTIQLLDLHSRRFFFGVNEYELEKWCEWVTSLETAHICLFNEMKVKINPDVTDFYVYVNGIRTRYQSDQPPTDTEDKIVTKEYDVIQMFEV